MAKCANLRINCAVKRHIGMTTKLHPPVPEYAKAYAAGRHAAKEHVPASENPHHPRSAAFHAWNDGHYDEQSARSVAIERHSAAIWNQDGIN